MNYSDAIKAVEVIATALRTEEQSNILMIDQLKGLQEDKKYLTGRLTENDQQLEQALQNERETREKLDTEIRRNGELKATLKQLLAEQMALAGRAAEMLRSLEDKPEIPLSPPAKKSLEEELDINEQTSFNYPVALEKFIKRDNDDIVKMPIGRVFVLDPPRAKDVPVPRDIKVWYRLTAGKVPSNWRELPGVEFRKEHTGKHFLRFTAPNGMEGREPLPFHGRANGTETTSQGTQAPSFNDDGAHIPGFLAKGPAEHDDQRGQS